MKTLILVAMLLSACQTTQPEKVIAAYSEPDANLTIVRDRGFIGAGCTLHIAVDNTERTSLRAGQAADLHITPGQHVVSISSPAAPLFCMNMVDTAAVSAPARLRIFTPVDGPVRLLVQP